MGDVIRFPSNVEITSDTTVDAVVIRRTSMCCFDTNAECPSQKRAGFKGSMRHIRWLAEAYSLDEARRIAEASAIAYGLPIREEIGRAS